MHRAKNELARITGFAGAVASGPASTAEHERLVPAVDHRRRSTAALASSSSSSHAQSSLSACADADGRDRARLGARRRGRARDRGSAKREAAATTRSDRARVARRAGARVDPDGCARRRGARARRARRRRRPARRRCANEHRARSCAAPCAGSCGACSSCSRHRGIALRRAAGRCVGATAGSLRPPTEALFLLPIAAVLVASSSAPAIRSSRARSRWIVVAGIAIAWISGAMLEGQAARGSPSCCAVTRGVAIAACVYRRRSRAAHRAAARDLARERAIIDEVRLNLIDVGARGERRLAVFDRAALRRAKRRERGRPRRNAPSDEIDGS